jgi:hypothetical protein
VRLPRFCRKPSHRGFGEPSRGLPIESRRN